METDPRGGGLSSRRKAGILAVCCLSVLITSLDLTIVNLAIPSIRADLTATAALWMLTLALGLAIAALGAIRT